MKNILSRIFKTKKAKIFTATILATVAVTTGVVFAYGPERPVFDWNNLNDRDGSLIGPVFNSFINTPSYGDERNFGRIAPVTAGQSPVQANFSEENTAEAGKEYWVRTFVHNNSNQSMNCLPEHKPNGVCTQIDLDAPGIAKNTRVRIAIAEGSANGVGIMSYISADNAINRIGQPMRTVWDSSDLVNNNQKFSVSYVPGSAVIYNPAHQGGMAIPNGDSIVSANGVPIGFDQMNGNLPGCFEFSAYVYVKVKVDVPQLEIKKQVRKAGETEWKEVVDAKPGETVQWLVTVTNTGSVRQTNVVASDLSPLHVNFVSGSAKWYNSQQQNGIAYDYNQFIIDNGNGGIIFGNYAPNGGVFLVRFDSVVKDDFQGCNVTIRNKANTKSDQQTTELSDTADVRITKENCQPVVPPQPPTPPPTVIPNTGAGSVLGIFAGTSILGAAVHRLFTVRRFGRSL